MRCQTWVYILGAARVLQQLADVMGHTSKWTLQIPRYIISSTLLIWFIQTIFLLVIPIPGGRSPSPQQPQSKQLDFSSEIVAVSLELYAWLRPLATTITLNWTLLVSMSTLWLMAAFTCALLSWKATSSVFGFMLIIITFRRQWLTRKRLFRWMLYRRRLSQV